MMEVDWCKLKGWEVFNSLVGKKGCIYVYFPMFLTFFD